MPRRFVIAAISLAVLCALFLAACSEPAPGEITGMVTKGGQHFGATIKAINSSGDVAGAASAVDGVYSIRGLPPGKYTVKCFDQSGKELDSKELTVDPDGSHPLNFELK